MSPASMFAEHENLPGCMEMTSGQISVVWTGFVEGPREQKLISCACRSSFNFVSLPTTILLLSEVVFGGGVNHSPNGLVAIRTVCTSYPASIRLFSSVRNMSLHLSILAVRLLVVMVVVEVAVEASSKSLA